MKIEIKWAEEATESGVVYWAEQRGIASEVYPSISSYRPDMWFWRVDVGSSRCEWPETYDCGYADTLELAQATAAKALQAADEEYPHVNYG